MNAEAAELKKPRRGRPPGRAAFVPMALRIPEADAERLVAFVQRTGQGKHATVIRALREFLDREEVTA